MSRRYLIALSEAEIRAVRSAVQLLADCGSDVHSQHTLSRVAGKIGAARRRGELQVAP